MAFLVRFTINEKPRQISEYRAKNLTELKNMIKEATGTNAANALTTLMKSFDYAHAIEAEFEVEIFNKPSWR